MRGGGEFETTPSTLGSAFLRDLWYYMEYKRSNPSLVQGKCLTHCTLSDEGSSVPRNLTIKNFLGCSHIPFILDKNFLHIKEKASMISSCTNNVKMREIVVGTLGKREREVTIQSCPKHTT